MRPDVVVVSESDAADPVVTRGGFEKSGFVLMTLPTAYRSDELLLVPGVCPRGDGTFNMSESVRSRRGTCFSVLRSFAECSSTSVLTRHSYDQSTLSRLLCCCVPLFSVTFSQAAGNIRHKML
ncbi:hypothetical protein F2P81_015393 [Scophthalmus maximus]|uniref:Uncharacterized protein n=1 Tax=Scophthalmus maximus TaxID=52904 RepID=A0A6A4SG42_SCOMX|nr:hypothetical protein F2P81_015393 [Scophthalmus maximus]